MEFVRHEPCYDRILFALTLDRKKMKERILIGRELEIRFRLQGSMDADILCDLTWPLGSFLRSLNMIRKEIGISMGCLR